MESTSLQSTRRTYTPDAKWQQEHAAFLRLLPSLLQSSRGKFVAVHDGKVVETGDDQIAVAMGAYRKVGYVPLHVGLVSDEPPAVVRLPSPRIASKAE